MDLGINDDSDKVKSTAQTYFNGITISKIADNDEKYKKWKTDFDMKEAEEIALTNAKKVLEAMKKHDRDEAQADLELLGEAASYLRDFKKLAKVAGNSGIRQTLDEWVSKDWIDRDDDNYQRIVRQLPPEGMSIVGGNEKMKYFMIGRLAKDREAALKSGYKILFILPGGDGSAEFNPFCKTIQRMLPENYLAIQLVAPVWSNDENRTVWPTKKLNPQKAKFTTGEFIDAVFADVKKKVKVDEANVFALGWSSGGPPIYHHSIAGKTLTGSFVAMSVFRPKWIPPLDGAKGHAYYILHSPDDWIKMDDHAKVAVEKLGAAGAKVKLETYGGGHGWRGGSVRKIREGVEWLEKQQTKK
jgi:predicted esterase